MQPVNDNKNALPDLFSIVDEAKIAKAIVAHYHPYGNAPEGLVISIVKALRKSEDVGVNWAYRAHGHDPAKNKGPTVDEIIDYSLGKSPKTRGLND